MSSKEDGSGEPKNKTFDKSQWRKNKYSHKSKVQQFEEKRRKSALHKYYKELKKSEKSSNTQQKPLPSEQDKKWHRNTNPFEKAKEELERRKKEKEQFRADKERQKAERKEALEKYKKEKVRKFKKLQQKTRKGQPVMAGRMELLLEKIQNGIGT